ncbi:MAG: M23 family metallopeptidase [Thermoanaerobaculales bacterium]|jgi:hypothetical protein|nr:M23 family metallopeptidase [Thermoanaerobaculales bacterium]
MQLGTRNPRKKLRLFLVVVLVVAIAIGAWLGFRVGPVPDIVLSTDYPAVGRATTVTAVFSEPVRGLVDIRLEVIQNDRVEVLASERPEPGSLLPWSKHKGTAEAVLTGAVGTDAFGWLTDDSAVVRATAERRSGFFRRSDAVVAERTLPVRVRPPRLEISSSQHYGRQGGAGAVVYRVGPTAVLSGVRAGDHVSPGAPLAGGDPDESFVIYALPWNLDDAGEIRLFAEDDAGNRVEQSFLDLFNARPPTTDTIRLSDGFLERVVPAISSRTPGFDDSRSLLDQYLEINSDLRQAELQRIVELSRDSEPAFLWSGSFLQMAGSAQMAGFAEQRSYVYDGRAVDQQTHLGLDLASTAKAAVPAPNSGRVLFAGWMTLYGNAVVIDHGYGLLSVSGHLSSLAVTEGEAVHRGQIIGRSGATGLAGGDHLHLEIFVHGQSVDPVEWLDGKWIEEKIMSKIGR